MLQISLAGQNDILEINEELATKQIHDISPYLYLFQDTSGNYSIDDVANDDFQENFTKDFDINIIDSGGGSVEYYWIRLTIRSTLDYTTDWLQYWDRGSYKIYCIEDAVWKMTQLGYLSYDDIGVKAQSAFTHDFKIDPGETKLFYYQISGKQLYIKTGIGKSLDKHIFTIDYLQNFERKYWLTNGLILGIFLAVAGYHLLIFFFRKYLEYLYFALFILSYAFVFCGFSRILSEWLLSGPQNEYLIILISIGWSAAYVFHYLFTRKFLDLPVHTPLLNRSWLIAIFLRLLQTLIISIVVLNAGGMNNVSVVFYNPFLIGVSVVGIVLFIFPIIASILLIKKSISQASIYLIAMMAFMLQMILGDLDFQKVIVLPDWFPAQGGAIITVFLFAIGIAHRFKLLEDEKNAAEEARLLQEVNLQKAQELEAFKSRFFTNISHEFRTPLTIILGITDQIKQHPSTWLDKGLTMIEENGTKLLTLIGQILKISARLWPE